jgi:isopentenyl-diphosphate delta-isomerase
MTDTPLMGDDGELVVLVDGQDSMVGVGRKLDVHRDGLLHRAVSVVLFDHAGRLLIQRRATAKYHSGGLWSNSCCGHPRVGESVTAAGERRLGAELGIHRCALTRVSDFTYYAELCDGLVEHELDHVLVGAWSGELRPDPSEVSETRWVSLDGLLAELATEPERFTPWTRRVVDHACRNGPGSQATRVDSAPTGD